VLPGSRIAWRSAVLGAALAAASAACARAVEPSLPAYNVDIAQTSISGVSSGAFMAVQFGMAWSSIVKGVGAIAGGPFGCSEGSLSAALTTCMDGAPPADLAELIKRTDAWSRTGDIDDTGNVAAQKIYLFHGYNDRIVARPVSDWLHAYYAHYLSRHIGNLFYQTAIGAGHAEVTLAYGGACNANGGEYINRCDYDLAGVVLQHIYGALIPRRSGALTGTLVPFSQAEFTAPDHPIDDSMDDRGFAYVPASCGAKAPCRLHIVLHGCLQSLGDIGEDFVRHAGYNEWADANDIIVLYPRVHAVAVTALGVTNPKACWDWWGYLDADPTENPTYLLHPGKQISAIKAMVDRVTGGAAAAATPAATPAASQPAAPAAVLAADRSDTAIDLVWSAVPGVNSYDVFRSDPGDIAFHQIGTIAGLSYGDAKLKPATRYQYRVRASSPPGAGAFSPIVSVATSRRVPSCNDPGNCPVQ
jgi:predicted esterase